MSATVPSPRRETEAIEQGRRPMPPVDQSTPRPRRKRRLPPSSNRFLEVVDRAAGRTASNSAMRRERRIRLQKDAAWNAYFQGAVSGSSSPSEQELRNSPMPVRRWRSTRRPWNGNGGCDHALQRAASDELANTKSVAAKEGARRTWRRISPDKSSEAERRRRRSRSSKIWPPAPELRRTIGSDCGALSAPLRPECQPAAASTARASGIVGLV